MIEDNVTNKRNTRLYHPANEDMSLANSINLTSDFSACKDC